jgi:hypothetical protein
MRRKLGITYGSDQTDLYHNPFQVVPESVGAVPVSMEITAVFMRV